LVIPVMLFIVAVLLALWFLVVLAGSFIDLLIWVVVGLIAGWIASMVMRTEQGIIGDILVGLAGALIGGTIYSLVTGRSTGGPLSLTNLVTSVIGAIILLAVLKAIRSRQVA